MARPRKVQPRDDQKVEVKTPAEADIAPGAQADKAERLQERDASSDADQGQERYAEAVDTRSAQHVLGIITDERQRRDGRPEDWLAGRAGSGFGHERALPSDPPLDAQPSPAVGEDAEVMIRLQAAREDADEKWAERNTPTNWNPEQMDHGREPEDAEVEVAEQARHVQELGVKTWTEGAFNEGDVPGQDGLDESARVFIKPDEFAANVGRNSALEPARLVRSEESASGDINPAMRFNPQPGGPQEEGAPANELSGGRKHDLDAPWPAPLTFASSSPSASPEPGPEPDFQHNPPQPLVFSDNPSAVRGTVGPSREEAEARNFAHLDYDAERVHRARRTRELEDEARRGQAERDEAMRARDEKINRDIEEKAAQGKGTRAAAESILAAFFQGDGEKSYRKFRAAMVQAEREVRGQGWARAQRRHAPK